MGQKLIDLGWIKWQKIIGLRADWPHSYGSTETNIGFVNFRRKVQVMGQRKLTFSSTRKQLMKDGLMGQLLRLSWFNEIVNMGGSY